MNRQIDPLHDTRSAAKILDVEPSTLEARRTRGGGPRYVKVGRLVKYRESDLAEFIEQNLRSNTIQKSA